MNGWAAAGDEPTIASMGEEQAIHAFTARLPESEERVLGPGDDAAVVAAPDGRVVVTSDSLVEGPDFRTYWSTPYDLGWKLAAVNLADVAAMGARPAALVVALALPRSTPIAALERIADGLADACDRLAPGCGVEGGDLAESPTITAVATAFGSLDRRAPVVRTGAQAGDIVALSLGAGQSLGDAARGLMTLAAWPAEELPDEGFPSGTFIDAQLRPVPPIEDGVAAAFAGATSMIDISDGLARDASRVARASRVTIDFDSTSLLAIGGAAGGAPVGGIGELLAAAEDHGLLATFPIDAELPGGFRLIGSVRDLGISPLLVDGEPLAAVGGWDPFRA